MAQQLCLKALQHLEREALAGRCGLAVRVPEQQPEWSIQAHKLRGSSCSAQLVIPWCGRRLVWTVLLQTLPPFPAPDFLLDDDAYQPLLAGGLPPDQAAHLAQLLLAWPATCASQRPDRLAAHLAALLRLLLAGYRDHQLARMARLHNDRLQFELSMLPSYIPQPPPAKAPSLPLVDLGEAAELVLGGAAGAGGGGGAQQAVAAAAEAVAAVPPVAYEALMVEPRGGDPALACLGLPLVGLDTSKAARAVSVQRVDVPLVDQQARLDAKAQRMAEACKLQVAFPVSGSRTTPDLFLQVPVELRGLGGVVLPALPAWDPHSSLLELLPQATQRLQAALDAWAATALLRQQVRRGVGSTARRTATSPAADQANQVLQTTALPRAGGGRRFGCAAPPCPYLARSCTLLRAVARGPVSGAGRAAAARDQPAGGRGAVGRVVGRRAAARQRAVLRAARRRRGRRRRRRWGRQRGRRLYHQPQRAHRHVPRGEAAAHSHQRQRNMAATGGTRSWRDYPWSPRWPASEMASRILTFLRAEIPVLLGLRTNAPPIIAPPPAPSPYLAAVTGAVAPSPTATASAGAASATPPSLSSAAPTPPLSTSSFQSPPPSHQNSGFAAPPPPPPPPKPSS